MSDDRRQLDARLSLMKAGLSRRQVLRILGISSASLFMTGLLAACTDEDDDAGAVEEVDAGDDAQEVDDDPDENGEEAEDQDDDQAEVSDASEPDGDDERPSLTIGVEGIPSTLDGSREVSLVGFRTNYMIYDTLIRRDFLDSDPPGYGRSMTPGLAESWEFVDDTTFELSLREDVLFHNGDAFTADDVVFTFERILVDTPAELTTARGHMGPVTSVEKVDDYTVRFHTSDPDPVLDMRLSVRASWIIPKSYYQEVGMDEFAQHAIATGPYRVAEFRQDDALILEANDEYWGGRPPARRISIQVIPEVSTRVAALVSGEVDIITNVPPDQAQTIEGAEGVHVKPMELMMHHMIRYNTHHPVMASKPLRQALNLAIDRELLVNTLWDGQARTPHGHQFIDFPEHLYFDDIELRYDPERVQELLEEADYDGETIILRVHPSYYTLFAEAAQAIVEMWNENGINAEVELTEDAWADDDDAMAHNWSNTSNLADPQGGLWLSWGIDSPPQKMFWDAPDEFNELGLEAGSTLDDETRTEIWSRIHEIWLDEAPGTPLYNPVESFGIRDGIQWQPYGIHYMDFRDYNLKINQSN